MKYTVFVDGLCEPHNPGGHGCWGLSVQDEDGNEIHAEHGYLGRGAGITNNVAEYRSLLAGIRFLEERLSSGDQFIIQSDSKLIVEQVSGRWRCNAPVLIPLRDDARHRIIGLMGLTGWLGNMPIVWIPREQNARADELSRIAYQQRRAAQPVP